MSVVNKWTWDVDKRISAWAVVHKKCDEVLPHYVKNIISEKRKVVDPSLCLASDINNHPHAELENWEPPNEGRWQVTCDAAYYEEQNQPVSATYGTAIRGSEGWCDGYSYGSSELHRTILIHEIISGKWGLKLASDLRRLDTVKDLDVYLDSQDAINQINDIWKAGSQADIWLNSSVSAKYPMVVVLKEIKELVDSFGGIQHVSFEQRDREKNFLADNLTRFEKSRTPKHTQVLRGDEGFYNPIVQLYQDRDYFSSMPKNEVIEDGYHDNHYIRFDPGHPLRQGKSCWI